MSRVVLTIGGSDSGGGAGIQADLKTFAALGLHGICVITAITAQNTRGVQKVADLGSEIICAQFDSVTSDFAVAYAKTGMLHSVKNVMMISRCLKRSRIPFVLDPVIEAEAGGKLLRPDALNALKEHLMPLARVVTPNIFEAEALTGIRVRDMDSSRLAAHKIMELGPGSVVIKGGHLDCTDLLLEDNDIHLLKGERVYGQNHGVGCTYSAALTSFLASGFSLKDAATKAKRFAEKALIGSMRIGKGIGPVNQVAYLQEEANRFKALCDVQEALDLLRNEPNILEAFPGAGSNLGMAIPGAASSDDIAALDSSLVRTGDTNKQSGCVKFGANSHVSCTILGAMSFDPRARAALILDQKGLPDGMAQLLEMIDSVRHQEHSAMSCEKIGLGTSWETSGNLEDVMLYKTHNGECQQCTLVGSSATQVAHQAIRLIRMLMNRKL